MHNWRRVRSSYDGITESLWVTGVIGVVLGIAVHAAGPATLHVGLSEPLWLLSGVRVGLFEQHAVSGKWPAPPAAAASGAPTHNEAIGQYVNGIELPGFTKLVLGGGGALVIVMLVLITLAFVGFPLKRRLVRDRHSAGWRLDLFAWRAFFGREVADNFRRLLFVSYANGLLRSGLPDRLSLSLASREAEAYREVDFEHGESGSTDDPFVHSLLIASKLGHLQQEIEAQGQIRLATLDESAERLQVLAAFVIRSLLYVLVGSLVVAMYLPIFRLGAAI